MYLEGTKIVESRSTKNYYSFVYVIFSTSFLLSIFQIYFLKIGNSYFSLVFLITFLLGILLLLVDKRLIKWKALLSINLIVIFQFISLAWSSDIKLGIRNIITMLIFLIFSISSYKLTLIDFRKILNLFKMYYILLSILVIIIILFRLNQNLEIAFLNSNFAKIFINPNVVDGLFSDSRNNIFDPQKSGGFFVNANVAAAFLGINMAVSFGLYKAYKIIFFKIIFILLLIGIFFTGSKAGLILTIVFIFSYFFIKNIIISNITFIKIVKVLFFINIIHFITLIGIYKLSEIEFFHRVSETIDIRLQIWNYGLEEFLKSPIIGQGFGGWQKGFELYALNNEIHGNFPPHNTLLYLWSQSGLIVVFFAILFMFFIIKYGSILIKSRNRELVGLGVAILGSFLWAFIHGMGTNFGLVGEIHMEIILGSILGYSYARLEFYRYLTRTNHVQK